MKDIRVLAAVTASPFLAATAFAQEAGSADSNSGLGLGLALLGGAVQLILGIALAITSISIGLRILSRVLPDLRVTEELTKGNSAVGVMSAGVVIAYTKVISTGITQIGESISISPSVGAFAGGIVNVAVGIMLASIGVTWAFRALDKVLPKLQVAAELKKKNIAVGLLVAGVLYGISEMIAAAVSGIGQALASALGSLI